MKPKIEQKKHKQSHSPEKRLQGLRIGSRPRLGEFLVKAGIVDQDGIERALSIQRIEGGRFGSILVNLRLCKEQDIRRALHHQLGVEVVDLRDVEPDPTLFDLLSLDLIRKYEVVPIKREGPKLWVAMPDPYNLVALEDIRFKTGIPHLGVVVCTEGDFRRFAANHLETRALFEEIMHGRNFYNRAVRYLQETGNDIYPEEEEAEELAHRLRLASNESPIITLCNFIIMEALRKSASDIHLEPHETSFRVRLRIDGRLHTLLNPPKRLHPAMTARLKVMSELDITKRRIPQDGHLAVDNHGETMHFRVSTLPTIYGEKSVIRLLKKSQGMIDLEHLGIDEEDVKIFARAMKSPQGLILATGPTGSGKTTTLHAGLACVNNSELNLVTLEDPVEDTLVGVNHVPINTQGGVTFANGLRAILRQDPDVICIGEIRDFEVASIAMRAAQTGHLVLSTLHTNSAVETIVRLIDLGIPSYVLSSTLLLVVAQRLVRRICEDCTEAHEPPDQDLEFLGLERRQLAEGRLRRGRGCPACLQTGFQGRVAIYEFLRMTREVRTLVHDGANSRKILDRARLAGTKSLLEAGLNKVMEGETTLSELQRVLLVED